MYFTCRIHGRIARRMRRAPSFAPTARADLGRRGRENEQAATLQEGRVHFARCCQAQRQQDAVRLEQEKAIARKIYEEREMRQSVEKGLNPSASLT